MRLFLALLLGVGIILCSLAAPTNAMGQFFFFENPLVGKPASDFTLETLKGGPTSLSDFRDGKSALIFFWATWCPHCRNQLHDLHSRAEEIEKKGVKIVLVDLGERPEEVNSYLQKNGMSFEVFLDREGEVAEQYGVIGVPTFVLLDREGIVRAVDHVMPDDYEALVAGDAADVGT